MRTSHCSQYKGSDGVFNTNNFPLAVPQLTIGYIFGTEFIARYVFIPKIGDDVIPSSKLWGIGVRHSISQYLPERPGGSGRGLLLPELHCGRPHYVQRNVVRRAGEQELLHPDRLHRAQLREQHLEPEIYLHGSDQFPGSWTSRLTGRTSSDSPAGFACRSASRRSSPTPISDRSPASPAASGLEINDNIQNLERNHENQTCARRLADHAAQHGSSCINDSILVAVNLPISGTYAINGGNNTSFGGTTPGCARPTD